MEHQKATLQHIMYYALLTIVAPIHTTMDITEWNMSFAQSDRIPTEYTAYKLLKTNPLSASVHYLAVPWAHLINSNQLSTVPHFKLNGGFTICQHIQFATIIPLLKKIGIDTLFTPHVKRSMNYDTIHVVPFPHYAVNGTQPTNKDIWYSFIGFDTDPVRREIFKLPTAPEIYIKKRATWHFYQPPEIQILEKKEYQDILARSRFSLCPRGTGASTVRFWESLQAGAIPVLISDEMCLPEGVDWTSCIIQIYERRVKHINTILSTIDCDTETTMRHNALLAYQAFSGSHFISPILRHYRQSL